jgi:hypothetical protein
LEFVRGTSPEYVEEFCQNEENQKIICGHTVESQSVFDFYLHQISVGTLVCSKDYATAKLFLSEGLSVSQVKFAINNALMVLYAIATATLNTVLFHAAAVVYHGHGYLFLGKSGTGKSTHARLWLKYHGAELLNDDNPVVRWDENSQTAVLYGSPWSGKTPCYHNESASVGAFVRLEQWRENIIERETVINAFADILASCSTMMWDKPSYTRICDTVTGVIGQVPVYHLRNLPNEAAAHLSHETISQHV